jgi:ribonuclease D
MLLITTNIQLENIISEIMHEEFVAIDTEFMRSDTYYPILSLIQIGTHNKQIVIDCLLDIDLTPIKNLLLDNKIMKVFHAGRQDFEIFYQVFGIIPQNIYDTQIAACFCGHGATVGYDTITHKILDITVDKNLQFSDWLQRPLTDKQLKYAALDVKYLREIYLYLSEILRCNNRDNWALEEMQNLSNEKKYITDFENIWQKYAAPNFKPKNIGALKNLCAWREKAARSENIPISRILKDQTILKIAEKLPKNHNELEHIQRNLSENFINDILEIINKNEELKPKDVIKPSASETELISILRILLKHQAKIYKIPDFIIANKEQISLIATKNYKMSGWRYEVFGKIAESFYNGNISMSYFNGVVLH